MSAKKIIFLLGFLCVWYSPLWAQPSGKPNIILILTDDQGYGDVGFQGNTIVRTPHLDRLSEQSTRFENFYTSPVCSPTRASLLTGRYSFRTGIRDTYAAGSIMASEEITLAELLADAGYATGIYGKWHLGDYESYRPSDQGFQHSLVHRGGGVGQPGDYISNWQKKDSSYFDPVLFHNNQPVQTKGYCSDVFTDGAIEFVTQNRENPFFLYLAFNAPHTPLQVPQKYYDLYKEVDFDKAGIAYSSLTEKEREEARRVYAMVSNIDDNIGRLWNTLRSLKLDQNTVLVFLSDNGNEQRRYNGGLRGLKQSVYEGGIRVPAFAYYPKIFRPGHLVHTPLAHIDLAPTLLEIAGVKTPVSYKPDGKSFVALARKKGQHEEIRTLFFNWNRGYPEPYRNSAVRRGAYKLVAQDADGTRLASFELYNLHKDPYETHNLITTQPEIATELKSELDNWYAELAASEHLAPRYIPLGSTPGQSVWLSRQDWYGPAGALWSAASAYGSYFVQLHQGTYTFRLHFAQPVESGGRAVVRLGQLQRSVLLPEDTALVVIEDVPIEAALHTLEVWYEKKGAVVSPFYVEVLRP
jgi:arylsulfatase A-like enzyme